MSNNVIFTNIVRFVLLVLSQVLIFNHLNFFGSINPMVYIIFLYWYPIRENRALFLLVCFLLGLTIDIFSDTLALHTFASLTIAYARPVIMRFCFGVNYEFQTFTFKNTTRIQRITFLALLVLTHHLIFFTFEILSFSHILLLLKKVLLTSILTIFICVMLSSLFTVQTE
ncbi:MAG: rod shape-determining protein MreD [Muricauda sp.]|nr:rod shape-determining protein MreD [Allomuricauda sp.]MAU27539.1 rod shape-determining protein MreD [Allomuricauda sp.]MBC30640.1 rod shape-determining protein MreD [Allomuricauda sp.]|tara:strand:+ start:30 stop:539 length:510 start_codon:yes stop_codon:yes gene_type:complete